MGFLSNIFGKKADFAGMIEAGAPIVDVRTPAEFKQGHIKGSVNIPLDQIGGKINKIKKMGQPVILCCASGMRSGRATAALKRAGMEAYNGGSWMSLRRYV